MNRVEKIYTLYVGKHEERPSKVKIPLGPEDHACSMSNAETIVAEIDRMALESLGWRVGRKSQVVSRTEDDVPPVGSDDEPTSQCRWHRVGRP